MKYNKLILIASSLFLTSCQSYENIKASCDGDHIVYHNTYDVSEVPFFKNEQALTHDKAMDIRNYFFHYATHPSNTTEFIFLYKGLLNGRYFKIDICLDSRKESNPYFLAVTYHLDDASSLPDSYFYYSTYFNVTDFKKNNYITSYYYDYVDHQNQQQQSYLDIAYSDISFASCPMIDKATYHLSDTSTIPEKGKKSEKELSLSGLEPIRAASCYLEKLLTTISDDYHLW